MIRPISFGGTRGEIVSRDWESTDRADVTLLNRYLKNEITGFTVPMDEGKNAIRSIITLPNGDWSEINASKHGIEVSTTSSKKRRFAGVEYKPGKDRINALILAVYEKLKTLPKMTVKEIT